MKRDTTIDAERSVSELPERSGLERRMDTCGNVNDERACSRPCEAIGSPYPRVEASITRFFYFCVVTAWLW